MKKNILLICTIILFSISIQSLPAYVRSGEEFSFTTYLYPYVFTYTKEDVTVRRDEKAWKEIIEKGDLAKKVFESSSNRFYINHFVIGFSRMSLDTILLTENYNESGFTEESLTSMKSRNLEKYMENFRKGYMHAHNYFNKAEDRDDLIDDIYYISDMITESPEALSYDLGYIAGKNYFRSFFMKIANQPADSDKAGEFIESYSYGLGVISYIRTYFIDG